MKYSSKFLLLLTLLLAGTVSAQNIRKSMTLQDLVGEWELTEQEASISDSRLPDSKERVKELTRITVDGKEVTIFKRFEDDKGFIERTYVYFADGSGETNRWIAETGTAMEKASKTKWKDGILIIKGNYKSRLGSMAFESRCRLSNDFLKLECEETQFLTGMRPTSLVRGLVTRSVFSRM